MAFVATFFGHMAVGAGKGCKGRGLMFAMGELHGFFGAGHDGAREIEFMAIRARGRRCEAGVARDGMGRGFWVFAGGGQEIGPAHMAGDAGHANIGDFNGDGRIGIAFGSVAALAKGQGLACEGALVGGFGVGAAVQGASPFQGDFRVAAFAGGVGRGSVGRDGPVFFEWSGH